MSKKNALEEISVKKRKVKLYLKGVKTVIGTEQWGRWGWVLSPGPRGGYRLLPDYKLYSRTKYESVLSNDHKRVVEIVEMIAHKHGFELEIIDVTKERILHRFKPKENREIKTFPTLIIDSGEKIEGKISEEQIELLLSKAKDTRPSERFHTAYSENIN